MQLDTHEHFSKSRNFAESDKTISSSVVKMKSVLQVTMTLIWKKIIIVLRYIPKAKHIRHLEHDTQQGNKNYKYRKGITLNDFLFLWFQSQWQGIKHFYSAFQRYKIHMKE